jgi:hypothetical protein
MRAGLTVVLAAAIGLAPTYAWAAQRDATSAEEVKALKEMAAAIPLGSRVKVQTRERRLNATLMSVTDDAIIVKREARMPEPAVTIRFDEIARLQRHDRKDGMSIAKALGVGVSAGAGAILTIFAIAMSLDD